jgi:hypothetical protein
MKRTVRVVVAGDDGKSRFEEDELELHSIEGVATGGVFDAAPLGPSDVALVRFAPGFESGFHLTPAPTWMFVMSGRMALGVSDDVWAELGPGDIVRMTDADGEGHRSRVLGADEVLMATAGYGG